MAARDAALKTAKSKFIVIRTGFEPNFYKNGSPLVASQIAVNSKNIYVTPQIIVVSNDGNKFIGKAGGSATASKSGCKALFAAADSYANDGTLPQQPTALKWYTTKDGRYRDMALVGIKGDKFLMGRKNKPTAMNVKALQPGAVKFGRRYIKYIEDQKLEAAVAKLKENFVYPETEDWISANGKNLKAQFVSLENDMVKLLVEKRGYASKSYNLSMDKLDEASQLKAKNWKAVLAQQENKITKAKTDAKALN